MYILGGEGHHKNTLYFDSPLELGLKLRKVLNMFPFSQLTYQGIDVPGVKEASASKCLNHNHQSVLKSC